MEFGGFREGEVERFALGLHQQREQRTKQVGLRQLQPRRFLRMPCSPVDHFLDLELVDGDEQGTADKVADFEDFGAGQLEEHVRAGVNQGQTNGQLHALVVHARRRQH